MRETVHSRNFKTVFMVLALTVVMLAVSMMPVLGMVANAEATHHPNPPNTWRWRDDPHTMIFHRVYDASGNRLSGPGAALGGPESRKTYTIRLVGACDDAKFAIVNSYTGENMTTANSMRSSEIDLRFESATTGGYFHLPALANPYRLARNFERIQVDLECGQELRMGTVRYCELLGTPYRGSVMLEVVISDVTSPFEEGQLYIYANVNNAFWADASVPIATGDSDGWTYTPRTGTDAFWGMGGRSGCNAPDFDLWCCDEPSDTCVPIDACCDPARACFCLYALGLPCQNAVGWIDWDSKVIGRACFCRDNGSCNKERRVYVQNRVGWGQGEPEQTPLLFVWILGEPEVTFTKALQMPESTTIPTDATFAFEFERVQVTGSQPAADVPAVTPNPTIAVSPTPATTAGGITTVTGSLDLMARLNGLNFPRAGIYVWNVREVAGSSGTTSPSYMTYDEARFQIRASVNAAGNVTNVDVFGLTNNNNTWVVGNEVEGINFLNTYVRTSALEVTKEICEEDRFVNLYTLFDFTIALTGHTIAPLPTTITARIVDSDGNPFVPPRNVTITNGAGTFQLAHGERLEVPSLPVGTTFNVTELAHAEFAPELTVWSGGDEVHTDNAGMNTDLSSGAHPIAELTRSGDRNAVDFVNSQFFTPPMGLVIPNASYVLFPVAGLLFLMVLLTSRRKRLVIEERS